MVPLKGLQNPVSKISFKNPGGFGADKETIPVK